MKFLDRVYIMSCWCLGALFIYAGITKLMAPQVFATLIEAYGIIPEALLLPVAISLPALEVITGIGLLLNIRGSLSIITVLLMLFVAILAYGIWMGLDVECGCFGPLDIEAEAFHGLRSTLYRDVAMLAGIAFMFAWRRYRAVQSISLTEFIGKRFIIRRR